MDAITVPYILSVLATVVAGRLVSIIMKKHFRDKSVAFLNFEVFTRFPLFVAFFASAALALQTPAIALGTLSIASFAPAVLLTYPVALFLGMGNYRYGVLKPIDPKYLNMESVVGLTLLYGTVGLTLATLLLVPAGGALLQGFATAAGVGYVTGVVALYLALSRLKG